MYTSQIIKIVSIGFIIQLLGTSMVTGQGLSDAGFLVGATAEAGSSTKEGLFDWKDADKVQSVIKKEFGLVQTTAYPAWDTWTGSAQNPKVFDLTNLNKIINWCETNNKKTAVHLITGAGNYFPAWFNTGNWTTAQVEDQLNAWITNVVTSNGNATKVDYWNVVNEAFTWDGKYWSDSTLCRWQQLGWEDDKSGLSGAAKVYDKHPVYIKKSFEKTRALTSAKLELRDYYIEFWDDSKKARAFYQLVKHLKNSGVPIDAVGFQGHFRLDYSYDWSKLNRAVKEYKALGLEVYITEVDYGDDDHIAPAKTPNWTPKLDSAQYKSYHDFISAAVSGGADWICLWGVADNTNDYWRKGQNALLFNEQYQPKRAYEGFKQGIIDGKAVVKIAGHDLKSDNQQTAVNLIDHNFNVKVLANAIGVNIYTISGKRIAVSSVQDAMITINNLSHGVYFLQIILPAQKPMMYKFSK